MVSLKAALLLVASPALYVAAVPWYNQCGGRGYTGPTDCDDGSECKRINRFYSQCEPLPPGDRPGAYEQCGGRNYDGTLCSGTQCCAAGMQCIFINPFYSQCIPEFALADLDEPCGPATPDDTKCALQSRASGPVFLTCSSSTDTDAKCVLCGFGGLACCPEGVSRPDRPQCQAAPRFTAEIPCTDEGICEGDVIG